MTRPGIEPRSPGPLANTLGEIYVEEEILGNLDINSKLGSLISGVVNST